MGAAAGGLLQAYTSDWADLVQSEDRLPDDVKDLLRVCLPSSSVLRVDGAQAWSRGHVRERFVSASTVCPDTDHEPSGVNKGLCLGDVFRELIAVIEPAVVLDD